jgi:hypothetical protein
VLSPSSLTVQGNLFAMVFTVFSSVDKMAVAGYSENPRLEVRIKD